LPANSVVLYRDASFWARYRWHVIAALAIIIAQTVLILALLFHRRQRGLAERARERAQAEVLQKRAELAHVSRVAVLGELSGTLAHEVNQPLTAILGNAAAAIRFFDAPEPNLAEVRAALADIRDDTRRAGEIVRRLHGMLKHDMPEFTEVDLNEMIRSVDHIVHSDAILHDVTVELDLAPGVLPARGDNVQLQQVILNLMVNAFAAMGDGREPDREPDRELHREPDRDARRLIVRTRPIEGEANVQIQVQDSGTGIPEGELERIFEPFITSKRDGLGMGLSLCRSIVERHGGRIWAANNPQRGATFSIVLPLARA
jgi:two-component system sensor kinase FixL